MYLTAGKIIESSMLSESINQQIAEVVPSGGSPQKMDMLL